MVQFLGLGTGADGNVALSGTDAPVDAGCTATGGTNTIGATNASFSANKLILVHQSQNAGVGGWEFNQIASYVAGTITTAIPLVNTYVPGAQVLVIPQYAGITVTGTLTAKAWNGVTGGLLILLSSGGINISGTVTGLGCGYRGATSLSSTQGFQGEGTLGTGVGTSSANGTGGGGGGGSFPQEGGGGGGNGAPGGDAHNGATTFGKGGTTSGLADLTNATFGGGGGKGGQPGGTTSGNGGSGGAIGFIWGLSVTITGTVNFSGGAGGSGSGSNQVGNGAGGAGGSLFIKSPSLSIATATILAIGGIAGTTFVLGLAGDGGVGRVRIETCAAYTASCSPSESQQIGGFAFCGISAQII